jgi:DNA-binding NtrC family response regulator
MKDPLPVKGTVLVVDDDRQMVKTLSAVLQLHGWSTIPAYSGEEAIRTAEAREFSAVLMDVKMPGINGVDAFRAIRRAHPLMPVILMTAYAAHDLLEQAEREGALMVMNKPVSWPTLIGLLDRASPQRRSVLLVDDDPEFLSTLGEVVTAHGVSVLRAQSLPEALRFLDAQAPAIVVLDLRLEGIQPADAVVAIKELSPAVILILCTGYPHLLDQTLAAIPHGWVHAGLTKPFAPERLLEVLDGLNVA